MVWETEKAIPSTSAMTRRRMVDFPAPDGAETMKRSPAGAGPEVGVKVARAYLDLERLDLASCSSRTLLRRSALNRWPMVSDWMAERMT